MTPVLSSASPTRAGLLMRAGLAFEVYPARVDEDEVKRALAGEGAPATESAETRAELKATQVARRWPGDLVIGADRGLECAGGAYDKPPDSARARSQLQALRGRRHSLHAAVAAARGGALLWHHRGHAELTIRDFSDAFLDAYLATSGTDVLGSVGAYRVEGPGIQLFAEIRGDRPTILGLPPLPPPDFLRGHAAAAT
ncbi:MAG: septum formation protein Maf [Alphaproteobacteria bacterium]|nr:septum formation protein Maf [Alphaproteobacteria bacterium]